METNSNRDDLMGAIVYFSVAFVTTLVGVSLAKRALKSMQD